MHRSAVLQDLATPRLQECEPRIFQGKGCVDLEVEDDVSGVNFALTDDDIPAADSSSLDGVCVWDGLDVGHLFEGDEASQALIVGHVSPLIWPDVVVTSVGRRVSVSARS